MAGAATASVNTFEPSYDLIQEEDCNTLLLYLPGFTKDQLKVQLTRARDLKISGTRQLENKTSSTFQKEFHVAEDCDTNKISAKFEDGILYVRQPKSPQKTTPSQPPHPQPHKPADEPPSQPPHPQPHKPADEPPRPAPKVDPPRPPTPTPKKAAQIADEIKQTATAKKSVDESREAKKKSSEGEGGKKEEIRKRAEEKSGGGAAAAESYRGVEADYKQLNAASPAARLKAARQQITNAVLLLFVFALGIYISKLPWFSKVEKP